MSYKVISTLVTGDAIQTDAIEAAITLATELGAHLDAYALGVDRIESNFYYAGAEAIVIAENSRFAVEERDTAEAWIKTRMAAELIPYSILPAVIYHQGLQRYLAKNLRLSDLVVLQRPDSENDQARRQSLTVEACIFEAERPLLMIPKGVRAPRSGGRILVGWNEGPEALSAVRAAMPFLKAAQQVDICIIDPPKHGQNRSDPGGQIAQYLGRHGVRAQIDVLAQTEPDIGAILSRKATEIGAEMLVTGAYGHSRMREAVFGGTSRALIESCPLPLLMAR